MGDYNCKGNKMKYARDNNGESSSLADIMEYVGMVKSKA